MQLAHRWLDRNLTRLELVVTLLLVAVFVGSFVKYIRHTFAVTEQTMVSTAIINIDTAMRYHAMMAMLKGNPAMLEIMRTQSPLAVIQSAQKNYLTSVESLADELKTPIRKFMTLPASYVGEITADDDRRLRPGNWYFDNRDRTLNYLVRNVDFFDSGIDDFPGIKLKVKVDFEDMNGDMQYQPAIDRYKSIELDSVGVYHWST